MGAPGRGQGMGGAMSSAQAADARGFFAALFDFSFTSFVTVKIIKVLYVLITVVVTLFWLGYSVIAFKASPGGGVVVLILGALFSIVVLAFWRLVLEAFVVVFRMAEDLRAVRERGDRSSR
jgi:ABC-type proline/glycine betaine transport system permease subunit